MIDAAAGRERRAHHGEEVGEIEMVHGVEGEHRIQRAGIQRQLLDAGHKGLEVADVLAGKQVFELRQHLGTGVDAGQVQTGNMAEQQAVVTPIAAADVGGTQGLPAPQCVPDEKDRRLVGSPHVTIDASHRRKMLEHAARFRPRHRHPLVSV